MTIALPAVPWQATIKPRLLDYGQAQSPPAGGASQYIARVGSRYAIDVTLPRLTAASARQSRANALRSKAEQIPLRLVWPKPDLSPTAGVPRVNGASQLGTLLVTDGWVAADAVAQGSFFSMIVSSQSYLYELTEASVADGSGNATLRIGPMIRASPADNTALNTNAPVIDGWIDGNVEWDIDQLVTHGISFTLTEAA